MTYFPEFRDVRLLRHGDDTVSSRKVFINLCKRGEIIGCHPRILELIEQGDTDAWEDCLLWEFSFADGTPFVLYEDDYGNLLAGLNLDDDDTCMDIQAEDFTALDNLLEDAEADCKAAIKEMDYNEYLLCKGYVQGIRDAIAVIKREID